MHFANLACALLSTAIAVNASPFANPDVSSAQGPPCNKDFSDEACGSCHYFRQCIDDRTKAWITPCEGCDHTSWCNCTAPPDILDPPQNFRF
ncbi:phd finger family protein [Diplodia corticola]|uniref:Phd finger family protein n=1 Tax=Diplodia corticola TaxID=236234 RepID=A0A1J9R590_9PEZI|nr:phd finger family protein [Diplodia corticola]OJD35768.1 phd finger family protein [Diplodia corticola]